MIKQGKNTSFSAIFQVFWTKKVLYLSLLNKYVIFLHNHETLLCEKSPTFAASKKQQRVNKATRIKIVCGI